MVVYKMRFKSGLHVDSRGSGESDSVDELIRSDTLSAALCLAWNTLFPAPENSLFAMPPFRVSSAFPYIQDLLLLPVPRWPFWTWTTPAERKRRKAVRWVSAELMNRILQGEVIDWELGKAHVKGAMALASEGEKAKLGALGGEPWVLSERQRVSTDRLGAAQEGNLFFFAIQFFAPHCGLFFLADVDAGLQDRFEAALAFLGDTGIGADRGSGLGHFEFARVEQVPWKPPRKDHAQGWITLSLFNPGPADDLGALTHQTAFGLTTRSGWMSGTTLGRPPIRVFTEGSYFSTRPAGQVQVLFDSRGMTDLGLSFAPVRDFRALALPCAAPSRLKGKAS